MIDQIIAFNKTFVEQKGYEKYLTSKYPDETLDTIGKCGINLDHWLLDEITEQREPPARFCRLLPTGRKKSLGWPSRDVIGKSHDWRFSYV